MILKIRQLIRKYSIEYRSRRKNLEDWAYSIRYRDNFKCVVCGKSATNSHHLLYRRFFPKLRFNLNNGVSLCDECNKEVHFFD